MKRLTLFALLLLGGCSASPVGEPFVIENELKEISFMGAHQEERCSKGCRYTSVSDTWYLRFCNILDSKDCITRSITHAPWKWQREGQRAKFTYQKWDDGWRQVIKITLSDTGEEVFL